MNVSHFPTVRGNDGLYGKLETDVAQENTRAKPVTIRLDDGRRIQVGRKMLYREQDGSYFLPYSLAELKQAYSVLFPSVGEEFSVPNVAQAF